MQKKEARITLINRWKKLTLEERNNLSKKAVELLVVKEDFQKASDVLVFVAQDHELDLLKGLKNAFPNKTYYIPLIKGSEMVWGIFENLEKLKPNRWDILEPISETDFTDFPKAIMVMPGLGANSNGYRLGFGGGFYDRWLSQNQVKKSYFCIPNWGVVDFEEESWDEKPGEVLVV